MTLPELFKLPAVRRAAGITEEQYKRLLMTPKQLAEEELEQRRSYLKSRIRASQKARLGPFYIDKYEVTNRQYRLFMAEEKDKTHAPGIRYNTDGYNIYALGEWKFYDLWKDKRRSHDDQPVTCVSEGDAIAYARWAGRSLPSQLHWERAAVGEGGRLFPWGSDFKPGDCRCRVRTAKCPFRTVNA